MKIFQTKDYDDFKKFPGNRKIKEKHVVKLMASIQLIDRLEQYPIIINQENQVIDGQHRLEAAKRLNIPIYYVVDAESDPNQILIVNDTKLNWVVEDRFDYWIEYGNKDYQRIKDLSNRLKISIGYIVYYAGFLKADIQNGKLKYNFTSRQIEELEAIREILDSNSTRFDKNFKLTAAAIRAFKFFFSHRYIEPKDMLKKFNLYQKPLRLTNMDDIVHQLCDIYNYKRITNRIGLLANKKKLTLVPVI